MKIYPYFFSSFIILYFTLNATIHLKLIFVYSKRQRYSFTLLHVNRYLVVLAPFFEKTIISSTELFWHHCLKSVNCRCMDLFWISHCIPLICMSFLCRYYSFLNYYGFVVNWIVSPPTLLFFFNIILAIHSPLKFHINIWISLFISEERH